MVVFIVSTIGDGVLGFQMGWQQRSLELPFI